MGDRRTAPVPRAAMELWATGLNAWGNLVLVDEPAPPGYEREYEDIPRFTPILSDQSIEVLAVRMTMTKVRTSRGMKVGGYLLWPTEACVPFGAEELALDPRVAVCVREIAAVIDAAGGVREYSLLCGNLFRDIEAENHHSGHFTNFDGPVIDIVANLTTFTALTVNGTVYTWGNERSMDSLGREVTPENPAHLPCVVEDLQSSPDRIIRISSGGCMTAALTSNHDVYIWGGGRMTGHLEQLWSPAPCPLDLNGHDFLDVAIGNNHAIVLTTNHKLFGTGGNQRGQLGLDDTREHWGWAEISLPLVQGSKVTRVYAAHNSTLLLVEGAQLPDRPKGNGRGRGRGRSRGRGGGKGRGSAGSGRRMTLRTAVA